MADATEPRLCLGDLLTEEPFALELLTGGSEAAMCEVRGAHAVEVDAPGRWLARDWIMLTTGVRLRGNAEAQRALVPQLEVAQVSALASESAWGSGASPRRSSRWRRSTRSRCSRCPTRRPSARSSGTSTAR